MGYALPIYYPSSMRRVAKQQLFDFHKVSSQSQMTAVTALLQPSMAKSQRKLPKNLRNPHREKIAPELQSTRFIKKVDTQTDSSDTNSNTVDEDDPCWKPDEIEAISSLFQGRIPQKPGRLSRQRPLPLPLPHKIRPLGFPTPKRHIRSISGSLLSNRSSLSKQVYKNPEALIGLAREISNLPEETDASEVLVQWERFLRKGSLSLTIRELGHMGLPGRALQTFCWAQKHPQFYPDDRILASIVEILARNRGLKRPIEMEKFVCLASRTVIEAMARGLIKARSYNLTRRLLLLAKDNKRTLDASIHAKFILELAKNPDNHRVVAVLLDELAEREDLSLKQQDCTAVMKVCITLGKFEVVESLFSWFKELGNDPSVVMYTTVIHSRYVEKRYREALLLVWEMEELDLLLDLPAYRVVIKVCVALTDLSRAGRYFSKVKEAGFSPGYDIYRDMIKIYAGCGMWGKVKELCKVVEVEGLKLDKDISL